MYVHNLSDSCPTIFLCVCVCGGEGEKLFVGIMVAVEFERLHPLAERET